MGRTKAEIKNALRIDTETISSQQVHSGSPVFDPASQGVKTTEINSCGGESSQQSRDASPVHSVSIGVASSPASDEPPEKHLPEEVTPNRRNLVDAKDLKPAPSTGPRPQSDSSTRSLHSHSHSPSIVNLGHRSVVRKRLTEMQHNSTSPLRISRRPALHRASHFIAHERPAGNSNSESVSVLETAKSGVLVNNVDMPVTAKLLTSPEPSQVSPVGDSDSDCLTSPASMTSDHATLLSKPKSAFRLRDEMRARSSTRTRTQRRVSERSLSPTSTTSHVDSQMGETVDALLDVMDVHAERQLIRTADLSDQLETVQNDVRNVAANVRVAILKRDEDSRHLAEIHTAVDDVRCALAHLDRQQHDSSSTAITQVVDERLRSNQAEIFQALEEIQDILKSNTPNGTAGGGAKPGPMTGEELSASLPESHNSGREHIDLADIKQKLNMLVELSVSRSDLVSVPPQRPHLDASQVRPIFCVAGRWNMC